MASPYIRSPTGRVATSSQARHGFGNEIAGQFFVYTFTKTTDWADYHKIKQDVLLKIMEIIEAHGAQVAFPTSTLHVPEGLSVQSAENAEELPPPKRAAN